MPLGSIQQQAFENTAEQPLRSPRRESIEYPRNATRMNLLDPGDLATGRLSRDGNFCPTQNYAPALFKATGMWWVPFDDVHRIIKCDSADSGTRVETIVG